MPEQIKSDVKLTNNRDANIDSILDKSKNLKWAYNDLGILINDLSNIPEKDRVKKYGIKNSDIEAFKEIRLGVVMHVQKTDPKGIGPDKFYYGSDLVQSIRKLQVKKHLGLFKDLDKGLPLIHVQQLLKSSAFLAHAHCKVLIQMIHLNHLV